jgi:rare lipoprotein A
VDRGEDTGKARFFSSKVNGGLTASGERLNSEQMMAGHPSYRLGSWVRVTNLGNGKSVEVKIVDRLPASSGRVINVSESAARQLDLIRAGTADVRLELVQHVEKAEKQ